MVAKMKWFSGEMFPALISFIFSSGVFLVDVTDGSKSERLLIDALLQPNLPLERPVENHTEPVNVKFGISVLQIINVDVLSKQLTLNAWLNLDWNAYNLRWDPASYENITETRIPVDEIWVPDIYAYNQAGKDFHPFYKTKAVVRNDGNVSYIPPGITVTTCNMNNITQYPLEIIKCELKFGSWVHSGTELDINLASEDGGDLSSLVKNAEWEVEGMPAKKNVIYYMCCPEPYVDVTFTLILKRRGEGILTSAKTTNFVIYGLLILSGYLGPYSAFKVTLGILALLISAWAGTVFNPTAGKYEEGGVPELAVYFGQMVLISFFILATNTIVYHFYYKVGSMMDSMKKLLEKSPIQRPKEESMSSRRSTLTQHEENYNDLQSLRANQQHTTNEVGDWKFLSIVVDKLVFIFWLVFLFLFYWAAFPSFD